MISSSNARGEKTDGEVERTEARVVAVCLALSVRCGVLLGRSLSDSCAASLLSASESLPAAWSFSSNIDGDGRLRRTGGECWSLPVRDLLT